MTIVNPSDDPARREEKLLRIAESLMRRVEHAENDAASSYQQFQRAVMLEEQVRERTRDIEATLALLNQSNAKLAAAMAAEQRARADLSNALEAVSDGFALFGGDGRLIMFNSRFCLSLPDVRAGLHIGVHIDDYVDLVSRSRYLDRAASGEPWDWAQWRRRQRQEAHAIFNVKLTDGAFFQISEHRTPEGGAAILQTDVTDMIRVERQERDRLLDDQALLVRATLDHINQGVVIFDREQRLAGWNAQLAALLTPPMRLVRIGVRFRAIFEAIGGRVSFLGAVNAAAVIDWVENRAERPQLEFEITQADRILRCFAHVMPDGGFLMSFADVTAERTATTALHEANEALERIVAERTRDLELALKEAERANASKTRFVAAAGHDLLQPLAAAKLFIASIESMDVGDAAVSAVRRAGAALESVETILDDLLEISKLDSGRTIMKLERIDLAIMLERLKNDYMPQALAKGLRLSVRPTSIHVMSDPGYLRRILQNLISNAIRYTSAGGVVVGVRRRAAMARIEVWDTGPGVPEGRREEIFEEFNRLDETVSAAEGLGLGLSIVDRAARLLGHRLSLTSRVGVGSCFAIEVPRAEAAATVADDPSARLEMGENFLALIIAEDGELRAALSLLLETWGLFVFEAATEAEALAMLAETGVRPDAIVADYAAIAQRRGLAHLASAYGPMPTAMITSDRSPAIDRLCRRKNWALIRAPFDATTILEFVAAAARPARLRAHGG